ncbi:MAG: efflux RND transporter periplasmic adaptor subunit [Burkholderiales bacterium]|nr:efflux RND transporter periplasmic adaptor subunit [Burkholderiales bacterium]
MQRFLILVIALSASVLLASCDDNRSKTTGDAPAQSKPAPQAASEPAGSSVHDPDDHAGDVHRDDHGDEAAHADDEHGHEGESLRLSDAELQAAGIRVAEAEVQTLADLIMVPATVQPDQSRVAHVAPKVSGRIVRVHVALGDAVRKGQVLATIDSIEVGEAQAAYAESVVQLDLAQANFERARQLFEEQIIPQKDWLQAQAELQKARAAERAAAGRLRLLGMERPVAEGQASSAYVLVAPLSGTVIEMEDTVQGELAKPEQSLFTVADLSRVWVQASLPEAQLHRVRVGAPATIEVTAYPGERFEGRVAYLSSMLDRETRSVQARIEVPNPRARLKMEMFANAHIETDAGGEQGLVVPRDAIVLMDGKPTLFVREGENFEARSVELGQPLASATVVRAGVRPGEHVVVDGAYALKARVLKSQMGEGHAH